jgi:pimeloyl-ACP methyl ester carboxylesterase
VTSAEPVFTEHFYRSKDGLELYYRQFGDPQAGRRTVMCLPGLTRNSRDFELLATELSTHYHVITPDLRGRGRSAYDPNWANYNPETYVGDVFRLLDEIGVPRCTVIGTSLGGFMGMIMGAMQPQRVAGLVLNDIGPELDERGITRIQGYAGKLPAVESWQDAAAQAKLVNGAAFPDLAEADWLDFARRTYREENGAFRPDVDPNIAHSVANRSTAAPDLWPLFRMLAALPMLTIRGALSDLFAAKTLERMREVKPDMQVLVVENRGHAPSLQEAECRRAIGEFLAGVS